MFLFLFTNVLNLYSDLNEAERMELLAFYSADIHEITRYIHFMMTLFAVNFHHEYRI